MPIPDPTKPPSISQMLATLNTGSDDDIAYIAAACYNLYAEANRRLRGRVLFGPADIKALNQILDILLTDREVEPIPKAGRAFKLNDEEAEKLLEGIRRDKEPS